jgi:signal-transduction protein with cAMP-binding, CBS, and nucleotidyltransferase domain
MADRFRRDQSIGEIMTRKLSKLESSSTIVEAAREMRDNDTGAIIVADGGDMRGLLTDRDIVVRAIAEGHSPDEATVGEICSTDLVTLEPSSTIGDAVEAMRKANVRRLPVAESGTPVGIISLGDLAMARDEESALADISSASPNN